tara:strand:- start:318 stop:2012 length:1695 start_codon:yes stop_codon:yes gene_type:complete
MKKFFFIILIFTTKFCFTQSLNLNEDYITNNLRYNQLSGNNNLNSSFTIKPLNIGKNGIKINDESFFRKEYFPFEISFFNEIGKFKLLPINLNFEYNTTHPYNRNNGTMIPNKGYQHLISPGFYFEIGPLSVQFKPEYHFAQNLNFDGFPESHYPEIWAARYVGWNLIDLPEKHGSNQHNKLHLGQSSIRFNFKGVSLGISNENIWWGPSIRNSIMMSNHARSFNHFTFNSLRPVETKIGNFEWQLVTGRLESSGFTPPNPDYEYAGTKLYIPKENQLSQPDWRYFQGLIVTFSPKIIDGLSLGYIRWAQMYGALVKGEYWWLEGTPNLFPVFSNLLRNKDKSENYEAQTDQAAGLFMRWLWKKEKAEIYAEYYLNDSKYNLRDFLLDTDHSRAVTLGLQKVFNIKNHDFLFSWEWTQLEQTGGRYLRDAGSWYYHWWVRDGYTNHGEVIGASIGPGSNSHYLALNKIMKYEKIGFAFEIIDNDNDFYYEAFDLANDPRRYWKDFNFHLNFSKKFKQVWLNSNLIFSRSLNYQWELDDLATPYYHPGKDKNNLHLNLKMTYFFN